MAIAKISKINIIGHLKDQADIMEVIQDVGLVEVQEYHGEALSKLNISEQINQAEYKLAGVKFGLNFLATYDVAKKSFAEKLNPKIELSEKDLKKIVDDFDFEKATREIQEAEGKINEILSVIEKAKNEKSQLDPWRYLSFIPNAKNLPTKTAFKLFILKPQVYQNLRKEIEEKLPLSDFRIVEENKKETRISLVYCSDFESTLSDILNNLNIKSEEVPDIDTEVSAHISRLEIKIVEQNEVLEKAKKSAGKLTRYIKDLKIFFDYFTWQKDKLLAQQKTANGWQTFSAVGWIDQAMIKKLEKELSSVTNDFIIEEIEPEKDEMAPVIFRNTWASPFEFVTGMYGAPKQGSPDPTPFLAPFFVIFFGLCLTDAGYGVILALLAWLGIKIVKPDKEAKKMFLVLMYGGLATFFAGAFVGGWFGIVIDNIQTVWLRNLLMTIRLVDPVKDPITMLLFSLGLGVVQILTGIIISLWWKIKQGDIKSAILDNGVWLYFLLSVLVWGGHKTGIINFEASVYFVLAGVASIVLTQGRKAKNPIVKLLNGTVSLYGLVGYLSDVLSYSRLLALGLATGIIGMVVNLIASLTIEMIPYLGYVLAVVVIIGGHVFNIAINALGSFIHASRLQFVEFFPKFMEGGGMALMPFKKESKYIKIKK